MLQVPRCTAARARASIGAAIATLSAGCVAPLVDDAPVPALQLLGSAELQLPAECAVVDGAVYRTLFDVQPDGRVTAATSAGDDGCVQQALRTWVSTFSYAPLQATTPVAFDWMIVTAARND